MGYERPEGQELTEQSIMRDRRDDIDIAVDNAMAERQSSAET